MALAQPWPQHPGTRPAILLLTQGRSQCCALYGKGALGKAIREVPAQFKCSPQHLFMHANQRTKQFLRGAQADGEMISGYSYG